MATQSNVLLVSDANRASLGRGTPALFLTKAGEMLPIVTGTDATSSTGLTKAITIAGLLATDIAIALSTDVSKGVVTGAACTANTLTVSVEYVSGTAVPFSYVVFRPTAPA